jgi:CRISPR-associated protein Cmr2
MSNKIVYFHFTLGPVQSFVSQARRTRDFWAGSFLLSWLSAVAIKAVQQQEGKILFPKADCHYLDYLEGKGKGLPPKQGSIPNRFKAEINNIQTFKPDLITEAVQQAWKALANDIWCHDIGTIKNEIGEDKDKQAWDDQIKTTTEIWTRQIESFWDISWIISHNKEDSAVLDQRKNWRTYITPEEAGVKCSIMEGWQELSGIKSPTRKLKEEQTAFWQKIRSREKQGIKSDLRKGEALCAIAFVKRRFSRYFQNFKYTISQKGLKDWQIYGWKVPSAVPSVSYMAAVHYLREMLLYADKALLTDFIEKAHQLTEGYGEWQTDIKGIEDAKQKQFSSDIDQYQQRYKQRFTALDGNVFFTSMLENANRYEDKSELRKTVLVALNKLNKNTKNQYDNLLDKVSPFYAVLMMDGDSLGSKMSVSKNQNAITEGLAYFINGLETKDSKHSHKMGVAEYVYQHNGFLIYAGGDDVLAILPLEDAIPCAIALRQHYQQCFKIALQYAGISDFIDKKGDPVVNTSISAAIEYVHIKTPLTKILKDAHHLLDDIAKEKTGRDSLAIRVWKPGGLQQQWSQPWEIALYDDPDNLNYKKCYLDQLVTNFQSAQNEDEQFSSQFFYKIREYFQMLNPPLNEEGKVLSEQEAILSDKQAMQFIAMEYIHSGETRVRKIKSAQKRRREACDIVRPLVMQCRPVERNNQETDTSQWNRSTQLNADGALIVRFLSHKGVE